MNKTTVIIIIVLFSIVYVAFDKFLSNDTPVNTVSPAEIGSDFSAIKPPNFSTSSYDIKESDDLSFIQNKEDGGLAVSEIKLSERKASRQELVDLNMSKKVNYVKLGDMLDNINYQNSTSTPIKVQITRIKHNLVISKKIAELTRNLFKEVNGGKELDQNVHKQILEIQKQIILPSTFAKYSSESD